MDETKDLPIVPAESAENTDANSKSRQESRLMRADEDLDRADKERSRAEGKITPEPAEEEDVDEVVPSEVRKTRCDEHCGENIRGKLSCYNWLGDIPGGYADSDMVEVQFKNTRKGFYKNSTHIPLEIGDVVAVEATPGHDIGTVSMVGALVNLQMRKANIKPNTEFKRIFRKAKQADIEKAREAAAKETDTMIRARKIAESLHLNMKIGDVEYQGDGNKAIFYYIADERVDFRQLIKVLADAFRVRIEMKQIGARQEAGRIGGIGPCGRPLCCSSWMTNFVTVATSAARFQDISLNPQKLAGQCAKLKCCLNFEVDTYVESMKKMPPKDQWLFTTDSTYYHFKTDIFKREITYSTDKSMAANLVTISAERAFEIIALNKGGEKPMSLLPEDQSVEKNTRGSHDILSQDELTRFDKKKKRKKKPGAKSPKPASGVEAAQTKADSASDKEPKAPQTPKEGGQPRQRKDGNQRRSQNRQNKKENRRPQNPADGSQNS